MLDRLMQHSDHLARRAVRGAVDRLAAKGAPGGVQIERTETGLRVSGRGLRRRIIENPLFRNFWR
jgi:hypothetical protein